MVPLLEDGGEATKKKRRNDTRTQTESNSRSHSKLGIEASICIAICSNWKSVSFRRHKHNKTQQKENKKFNTEETTDGHSQLDSSSTGSVTWGEYRVRQLGIVNDGRPQVAIAVVGAATAQVAAAQGGGSRGRTAAARTVSGAIVAPNRPAGRKHLLTIDATGHAHGGAAWAIGCDCVHYVSINSFGLVSA